MTLAKDEMRELEIKNIPSLDDEMDIIISVLRAEIDALREEIIINEWEKWKIKHTAQNYGRYDAFRAGYLAALKIKPSKSP
jgi:hypothetical protein